MGMSFLNRSAGTASRGAVAIMTSGGDAPGMNACLRGAIRSALAAGYQVFAILEGYQGLIEGEFHELHWSDVSGVIGLGGTLIGTARSQEFRERAGRLKAAHNLVSRHIDKLIVIGGDGSLSGAEVLRSEWHSLLSELAAAGEISADTVRRHGVLTVAGAIGSIDNDMADSATTIGADSALHRIMDAVDAITSTAYSHQRTFIIEVMGRNCGYLALMSAIAAGASACFIPEAPPADGWEELLAKDLQSGAEAGRRVNLIIVAEGARDRHNQPLGASRIQTALKERGLDSRITILGHVQRGGTPSAYDRYTSTLLGRVAVQALADADAPSRIAAVQHNRVTLTGLTDAVNRTRTAGKALAEGRFEEAAAIRGDEWQRMIEIEKTLMQLAPPACGKPRARRRIGVVTAGRAASGMNSAVRTIIRLGLASGAEVLCIEEGPAGMIAGKSHFASWMEPELWSAFGGSVLGAGRYHETHGDIARIAENFRNWQLDGLILIGDWGGYRLLDKLHAAHTRHPEFDIPMVAIPASINNDLPGTEYSIGCDTALNAILEALDRIKDSTDTAKRSYVVEVMGRYSGYLAVYAALASGAEYCYIPEEGITLERLRHDVRELSTTYRMEDRHTGLIIRNENADDHYTTDFIASLFEAESGGAFDVRKAVLGPIQQGGAPTPMDRIEAVRFAYAGVVKLLEMVAAGAKGCFFLGSESGTIELHPWKALHRYPDPWTRTAGPRWWSANAEVISTLSINPEVRQVRKQENESAQR